MLISMIVQLHVIGVYMRREAMLVQYSYNIWWINKDEDWSQKTALRNTIRNQDHSRRRTTVPNTLRATREIGAEPSQGDIVESKSRVQSLQEDNMIDRVKSRTQISGALGAVGETPDWGIISPTSGNSVVNFSLFSHYFYSVIAISEGYLRIKFDWQPRMFSGQGIHFWQFHKAIMFEWPQRVPIIGSYGFS